MILLKLRPTLVFASGLLFFSAISSAQVIDSLHSSVERVIESHRLASAATALKSDFQGLDERPFTIQVASYLSERDAIQHAEELRLTEEHVFYYPIFFEGEMWFKVCVGRFDSKNRADRYLSAFSELRKEPFAVTVSLKDRPGEDSKAIAMMKASNAARSPASINVVRESAKLPVQTASTQGVSEEVKSLRETVTLMPKSEAKKETQKPSSVASANSPSGVPRYAVQIAAFQTSQLAQTKIKDLNYTGYEFFYRTAVVNGQTWYRVMVGYFGSHAEAKVFQTLHSEKNNGAESIIRRIAND